jgi:Lon protease-like protein
MAGDLRTLGMFPLSLVLFPTAGLPLQVFEPRYLALMADCLDGDGEFGVVLISRGSEVGGGDQRVAVGTSARISHLGSIDDGRLMVLASGVERLRVVSWLPDDPYPRAEVEPFALELGPHDRKSVTRAERAVRHLSYAVCELGEVPALPYGVDLSGSPEEVAWRLCSLAPLNLIDHQELLAASSVQEQMECLRLLCEARTQDVVAMLSDGLSDGSETL